MTDPQDDKDSTDRGSHAADADGPADGTAEPVRNDPTAPIWAEPTTTMPEPVDEQPATPTGDGGPSFAPGATPYAESPPLASPSPPGSEPPSNPYAYGAPPSQPGPPQPEPAQSYPSYGQPQQPEQSQPYPSYGPGYGQSPQPEPGQAYPAYGQGSYPGAPSLYAGTSATNTSAIVLTVVAGLTTLTTCVIGIPSLILGILALTSNSTDPEGSRRKARIGWIVYAANWAVVVAIAIIAVIAIFVFADPTTTNGGF